MAKRTLISDLCRTDEGDERLSLSHAVDKKEISTDILLEGDGERGGKSTKLSILMGLLPAFSVLEIPTAMYTSSPKSLVSEHLSSDLSDDTVVTVDKKEIIGTIKKYEYLFVERR
jgi:hypothetical protein